MFVHLRTHSYYSFLRGVSSPEELVLAAVRDDMVALALTDYASMTGAIEFYRAAEENGIHPILGMEVPVRIPSNLISILEQGGRTWDGGTEDIKGWTTDILVLLAEDLDGWRSLCRLSSKLGMATTTGFQDELSLKNLAEENAGLVCICGGKRGVFSRLFQRGDQVSIKKYLNRMHGLFNGRLYVALEYQESGDKDVSARLVALADELSIPAVATQDIYYVSPEEEKIQQLVTAMRLNQPLAGLPVRAFALPRSHFLTQSEMAERFANYPEAIKVTSEIAERCQVKLPLGEILFPEIDLPGGENAMQVLRKKAEEGARFRYGQITPDVWSRLEHELQVIDDSGYASIFLVMEEIIQFARENSIPVSSRGSAASSLVAHCLGITDPDPLALNLYFERFLNPARSSPPDIDTDLCSRRRDEVIDFVYERFGKQRVAMVCTINCFRRRSALREVAKAYGLPQKEIKNLVDRLPRRGWGPPDRVTQQLQPYEELKSVFPLPVHQSILSDAEEILGNPRHLSIHPGGIVIAPGAITDFIPTQLATKGVVITQFDLDAIEQMGLVKIDLLGIRGLTVLNDVGQGILDNLDERISFSSDEYIHQIIGKANNSLDILEAIPEVDQATAELVRTGGTIGCFQIESPGMRATLRDIQASSKDDIMAALALYRPGPLTGGLKNAFVRRHLGQEEVKHLDPALSCLLKDTYGVILYQEQVLRIAHELAGLSLADADLLRRAMSHFDPGKQMQTLKEKFIAGAYQRNGVPENVADRIWEMMAAFAGYGFPKAHAASYAQVAWRSAWCKTHFTALFMAAVLANWGGYYRQSVYLTEARRLGLAVRPPHINFARREFSLSYIGGEPILYMGLDQVRDLTKQTQKRIMQERPFHSMADFLTRVDPRPGEAENLVKAGALQGMGTVPRLLDQMSTGGWRRGQLPLFDMSDSGLNHGSDESLFDEDWSIEEKVAAQETILGVGLDAHPLELVSERIHRAGAITTSEAVEMIGKQVRVAGMRQTWRRGGTNKGERLYVMSLEDLDGMLNVVIFNDVYRRVRREISGSGPYVVEGQMELDQRSGEPYLRLEKIWRL